MHAALRLPEILAAILSQVADPRTLFACVQVSKLWADEASNVLWDQPPILELARVNPTSRRQWYAAKVRRLDCQQTEGRKDLSFTATTLFPRLSAVCVEAAHLLDEQVSLQFLQSRLQKLEIYGDPISDALLVRISVCSYSKRIQWLLTI